MVGVRAAVVPIIVSSCLGMRKSAIKDRVGLVIAAAAFLLLTARVSNIYIIFAGGVAGLLVQTLRAGRVQPVPPSGESGGEKGGGAG